VLLQATAYDLMYDRASAVTMPPADPARINEMIASIEDNSRQIYILAKEKNKIAEKISATLDFLRLSKKYLTRDQIDSFTNFSATSQCKALALRQTLSELDTLKPLDTVRRELLHNNSDLSLVYSELDAMLLLQRTALGCLEDVLDSARSLMRLL